MNLKVVGLRLREAVKASTLHLVISFIVTLVVWVFVVRRWFPDPYDQLAGGVSLLFLMFSVDVICGPLLTLVIYNPQKKTKELMLDIGLVASVQLAALAYGLYSIAGARPVVLAFEVDRFVAVPAAGVDMNNIKNAPEYLQKLSWSGPVLIGTRTPKDAAEQLSSMEYSLQGLEISARPDWWVSYEESRQQVVKRMKKFEELNAAGKRKIGDFAEEGIMNKNDIYYLPVTGVVRSDYIALLDNKGYFLGFINHDGF